ncbi:MAG TPA: HD domain-containing phosphohydrolase, partial [Gemmatimonadales bacterium]|nr:HD domain-containing phosphohydrolase [Gemmatimonadales bacterium]
QLSLARTRVARRVLTLFVLVAVLPTIGLSIYVMQRSSADLERESLLRQHQNTKVLAMSVAARLDEFDRRLDDVRWSLTEAGGGWVDNEAFLWVASSRLDGSAVKAISGTAPPSLPPLAAQDEERLSTDRATLRILANQDKPLVLLGRAIDPKHIERGVIWAAVDREAFWGGGWTEAAAPTQGGYCVTADRGRVHLYCSWAALGDFAVRNLTSSLEYSNRLEWTHDGEEYLGSVWPLFLRYEFGVNSWQVIMMESKVQVLASVNEARALLWPALIFGLLVIFTLVHRLLGRSLEPLAELKSGTLRLARREFDQPIEVKTHDEFGELAASFNQMAGDLGRHFGLLSAIGDIQGVALAGADLSEIVRSVRQAVTKTVPAGEAALAVPPKSGSTTWSVHTGGGIALTCQLSADELQELATSPGQLRLRSGNSARSYTGFGTKLGESDCLILPLFERSELAGALVIRLPAGGTIDDEGLDHLRRLADSAAVSLGSTRLLVRLKDLSFGALSALARTVDANSPWTAGHSERVTTVGLALGRKLGLNETELERLQRGALLHDIGKISVPSTILDKPAALTPEERERINSHPVIGARILAPMEPFADILPIIRHHHEWFNGAGYPDRLAGEEIPWLVRIVSVADVFDALVSDRPYRLGMSVMEAVSIIYKAAGTQFDPRAVVALGQVIADPQTMAGLGLAPLLPRGAGGSALLGVA